VTLHILFPPPQNAILSPCQPILQVSAQTISPCKHFPEAFKGFSPIPCSPSSPPAPCCSSPPHSAVTVHRSLPLLSCDSNDSLPSLLSLWSFCSINPSPSISTRLHNFQGFPLTYSGGGCLVAKSCLTLTTPWTVACQAPLSMVFSRQEYWRGLPSPSPEYLPNPEIELRSPEL